MALTPKPRKNVRRESCFDVFMSISIVAVARLSLTAAQAP
jgi:hypothetical protein